MEHEMGLNDLITKFLRGGGRIKPQVIMISAVASLAVLLFLVLISMRKSATTGPRSSPFRMRVAKPSKPLDYEIIKMDTIPFNKMVGYSKPASRKPRSTSPVAEKKSRAEATRSKPVSKPRPKRTAPGYQSTPQFYETKTITPGVAGDMIIVNKLGKQSGNVASTAPTSYRRGYAGTRNVRLKVILPQRTPVVTGSLVEVRVVHDSRFGDLYIPKRSQLTGIATIQRSRVNIRFNELKIQDETYNCAGEAYDLKLVPGLEYNALSESTKKALFDELRSAAWTVPFVGRIVNEPGFDPLSTEVTTLDEGTEFYAVIRSIF